MSLIPPPFPPGPSPEPVFRLSVEQYHAMIDASVLTDDDPVELLEGILVYKMPKKPPHRLALRKLCKAIERLLPDGWFVQAQEPITLSDGEPEPDAAVIRGSDEDYATRHPGPADVALVVEVADTTLERDRTIKLRSYAAAKISVYWIVDLIHRTVEVYSQPQQDLPEAAFAVKTIVSADESIEVVIAGTKMGTITVRDVLPPIAKKAR